LKDFNGRVGIKIFNPLTLRTDEVKGFEIDKRGEDISGTEKKDWKADW